LRLRIHRYRLSCAVRMALAKPWFERSYAAVSKYSACCSQKSFDALARFAWASVFVPESLLAALCAQRSLCPATPSRLLTAQGRPGRIRTRFCQPPILSLSFFATLARKRVFLRVRLKAKSAAAAVLPQWVQAQRAGRLPAVPRLPWGNEGAAEAKAA
jgi:hypothetical protein